MKSDTKSKKPLRRKYKNIPCRTCISLPICIATYKKYNKENLRYYKLLSPTDYKYRSFMFLKELVNKCSLIVDYSFDDEYPEYHKYILNAKNLKTNTPRTVVSMYRIEKLKKFFFDKVYKEQKWERAWKSYRK